MLGQEITFRTASSFDVESGHLTVVPLSTPAPHAESVELVDDRIVFRTDGWFEILLEVKWDPAARRGTRFSHTAIPGQQPLHSEAISAAVLADISGGRQLLRGNTLFGPERTTGLALEVWQDSGEVVELKAAAITVRELAVPWSGVTPPSP